jgi:hypothetical protein
MKSVLVIAAIVWLASGATLPTDNLRVYYTFDSSTVNLSTVTDMSGHGYTLTSSQAVGLCPDRFSRSNGALLMNGSYYLSVSLPDSVIHAMTDENDFTFGIMFNTTATSTSMTGRMDIAGMGDPYNNGIFLSMHNNRLRIFLGNHGYYDTKDSLNEGKWHSAIAVRSQGAVFLYIDGVLDDQGAVIGSIYPVSDAFVIGRHGIKNESYYRGMLDDVFYYTRAFSADEISMLYRVLTGATISFATQIDTFRVPQPSFAWRPVKNAIAYALEIGKDSLFTMPFLSVPLEDTAYIVPQAIPAGNYFMRVGCNFDDRSPFFFLNWHSFVVK